MKKSDPNMRKHTYQKMLVKCKFLRYAFVWLTLAFACTSASGQEEYLEKSFFLQQLRVQIASRVFAERVALPLGNTIGDLPKGFFALEFLVERREGGPALYCGLKIYFDNSLHPYTPVNSLAGSLLMLRSPTHFFFRRIPGDASGRARWSESDRVFSNTKESEYFRYAAIASGDYEFNKKGVFSDFAIREFHREILPGVAYAMLAPDCLILQQVDPNRSAWKLWIKREGAADYGKVMKMEEKDFIIFELPRAFLERVRPIAARVSAYNNANVGQTKPADR